MPDPAQTRLHLTAPREQAMQIYQALEVAFEDDGFPLAILEVDEAADIQEVSLYADGDLDAVERRVTAVLARIAPAAVFGWETVPDIDWVAQSLAGLKPVRAGRLLVHGAHDRDKRRIGDVAIEVEAGLAFGSGHHGTTAGCLAMILETSRTRRPRSALDLGTGSGVLAIAMARLLRIPVLATDIDPVATGVAAVNARLNHVAALVEAVTATGFHHPAFAHRRPFDLIVANILARPLMRMAPQMARHVAPGGTLILSGILARQRAAVIAAYVGQRFHHRRTLWRDGWVTLHLTR